MDWMTIIGGALSVGSGGIFGVLGSAFGAWMKNKERAQKAIEQDRERLHQKEMFQLNLDAKNQGASWDALNVTHQTEVALNGQPNYQWVVAIKTLFRPFLTIALWVMVGWQVNMLVGGQITTITASLLDSQSLFNPTEIVELFKYVLYSTVFAASTATMWWFGERALSMPESKNR